MKRKGCKLGVLMKLFKWLMLVPLLYSGSAAAAWTLNVQYDPRDDNKRVFYVSVVSFEQNDPSPNPLYRECGVFSAQRLMCEMAIVYTSSLSAGTAFTETMPVPGAEHAQTMGELAKIFADAGYLNRVFKSQNVLFQPESYCFLLAYRKVHTSGSGFVRLPGGSSVCQPSELIPTFCDFTETSLELNHGRLTPDQVNGHTASAQISASCTTPYWVRIRSADKKSVLEMGEGLKSDLKVNGVDLAEGMSVRLTPTAQTFTITSTLNGYSQGEGEFQGSTIIILGLL